MYEHAVRATIGARSYQEDASVFWPSPKGMMPPASGWVPDGHCIAVLADGMGGHAGGALASQTVCQSFLHGVFTASAAELRDRLMQGLTSANDAIAAKVDQTPSLSGMGSTVVGTIFGPRGLEWISVGDSPMYLIRRGEIALLNADHSLAPALDRMVTEGRLTAEQARNDPRRHMLRSAVTGDEIELVDLSQKALMLEAGDHVVIASDGIHSLEPDEIARVVTGYAADSTETIAAALIRAVENLRVPYQDNTTAIVVRLKA